MLAEAYTRYQPRLRQANALDFDDLIMTTVNILRAFPDVAEHYRRRFRHVWSTSTRTPTTRSTRWSGSWSAASAASATTSAAGVPPAELTVVGDADQSIYAFRGATIRNILEFEEDYPDAAHHPAGAELPLHADHPDAPPTR